MMIDAHVHVWDPGQRSYPWLTEPALRRRFDLDEYARTPVAAAAAVLVQALDDPAETSALLAAGDARRDLVVGVVGSLGSSRDGAATIAGWRAGPGGDLLRGIRNGAAALTPELLRLAGRQRLSVDVLAGSAALPAISALASDFPDVTIVLDHLAGLVVGEAGDLAALAGRTPANVVVKLSGLNTRGPNRRPAAADELARVVARLLDGLGADRLLFGSDWPVALLGGSLAGVMGLVRAALDAAGASAAQVRQILSGTAARVYRIRPT